VKLRSIAAAALAVLLSATACVDNYASIELFGLCGPPADAEACEPPPGECDLYVADRPWMATNVNVPGTPTDGYLVLGMQFNNQLPNNADETTGRVNTNDFIIDRYLLDFSAAGFILPSLEYPTVAPPVPASGSTVAWVPIIPIETANLLDSAMTANSWALVTTTVRVEGHLLDGSTIETGPFEIPVDVFDIAYAGATCPTAGDVVLAYCPRPGQTGTFACGPP